MKSVSLPFLSSILVLLLTTCSSPKTLPDLVVERLNWMDEVAEAKRAKALPMTDPVREADLLLAMTQRGVAAGVQAERVCGFFTGQMQAAKVRQKEWLREHPSATTRKVPDLIGTVRPALDKIGAQMIVNLSQPRSLAESEALLNEVRQRLSGAGYSAAVMQPALEGLQTGLREHEASKKP